MNFTLFNNTDKRVVDDLKVQLKLGSKLQIAADWFFTCWNNDLFTDGQHVSKLPKPEEIFKYIY